MASQHLVAVAVAALAVTACSESQAKTLSPQEPSTADAQPTGAQEPESRLENAPIEEWKAELLELSFSAVSGMPLQPHIKNRSRAQEKVIAASLALDQPERALRYAEDVKNWRRGVGYADLAYWGAQNGEQSAVIDHYLGIARDIAYPPKVLDENGQELREQAWRLDRIKGKITRTLLLLDRDEEAAQFEANLTDSERGKANDVRAMKADDESFGERIQALDLALASGGFDLKKNALEANVHLFDRFYDDEEKRDLVETKIKKGWKKLPIDVRFHLLRAMAGFAIDHSDSAKANSLIEEAQELIDSVEWTPEHHVPLMANLAELRYRAGDAQQAADQARDAYALFDTQSDLIVDIFRAETLTPLAEAYQTMGERANALRIYRRAFREAIHNPNSWPRSEDLAETCCSMALHGVEPDEDLWKQIRAAHESLGAPW